MTDLTGKFDDVTKGFGTNFQNFLYSIGGNFVAPVGAAVCAVFFVVNLVKAFNAYSSGGGAGQEFYKLLVAAGLCLFGALALGGIWVYIKANVSA